MLKHVEGSHNNTPDEFRASILLNLSAVDYGKQHRQLKKKLSNAS